MKENNQNVEILESKEEVKEAQAMTIVHDFNQLSKNNRSQCDIFTNITDQKKIFNLESKVDNLLNDCEGELIRVKEVLIKRYIKPLKEPIVDEETGEILKDKEYSFSCVLLDDNNKSYATGSKIFTIQMMKYLEMFGVSSEGFEIKIVKNKTNTGNKALNFELV